jgi:hypothetical protein
MVETRAQARGYSSAQPQAKKSAPKTNSSKPTAAPSKKRKVASVNNRGPKTSKAPEAKRPKTETEAAKPAAPSSKVDGEKLDNLMAKYGHPPLSDIGVHVDKMKPSEQVMVHIFNAMLSSGRISHSIAAKSVKCLIDAGYADLTTLKASTWQKRTEVLTEGGYTHYREKTATALGELAELIEEKYAGDASNIFPSKDEKDSVGTLSTRIKEIKQIGTVGVDVFIASTQGIYTPVAPYLDQRSLKTAKQIGLSEEIEDLYEALGNDERKMAELNVALTTVRLEKKEKEFR